MPQASTPTLYGISKDNSSRHGSELWGKNQFNSTFPLALCLLMRDEGVGPVAIISKGGEVCAEENVWGMDAVVGKAEEVPYYHFEKEFMPYIPFSRNVTDQIDLVVAVSGIHSIPIEVKLTVVPDSTTSSREDSEWAPELVMRPVSSAHAMMGVASRLRAPENAATKGAVIDILRRAYNAIPSDVGWTNQSEIKQSANRLREALSGALLLTEPLQQPFLMQPIWKTEGQSLVLRENCFDVFVWSDVAMMMLPIKHSGESASVSRQLREVARHVRALYDLLVTGDFDYQGIYKGMSLGLQTDKAFAMSGMATLPYMRHARLIRPHYGRDTLQRLVLNGGESQLKPERRFDAAVLGQMTERRTQHG